MNSTTNELIRVAVVGVGAMGHNHARVYASLKNVQLVGIYDNNQDHALKIATQYGCKAFSSLEDVAETVDAVNVCTPSITHAEVGCFFLEKGIHCLIEKPLATTVEDCARLIVASQKTGAKLLVGHIERFNPAVQLLSKIISNGVSVHALDARRLSAVSKRITDVDVVADLMIHDLEIILSIMNEEVVDVSASGVQTGDSRGEDYVTALITFKSGTLATCTASRITQSKVRALMVTTEEGLISIDYVDQSLQVSRHGQEHTSKMFDDYAVDIAIENAVVRRSEPLQLELQHFINVIEGSEEVMVSGEQGMAALKLVNMVQESVASRKIG